MNALVFLMLLEAAASPPAETAAADPAPSGVRVRGGIQVGPGIMHAPYNQSVLPGGILGGRIGLQIHPVFAIAYQGAIGGYAGGGLNDDEIEHRSYFTVQNAPMILVTPIDFLEFGAGPAVDGIFETGDFDTGVAVGVDARFGGYIPLARKDERRFGVGIAFDFRPMNLFREINPDFWLLNFQLGVGLEWY